VIWLHGLGADGHDFVPIVEEMRELGLAVDEIKFIFPHAPFRSITRNHGAVMRGWYDIDEVPFQKEDEAGIRESVHYVHELIEAEHQAGLSYERIILAGFSQGGAIALYAGLTLPFKMGGILALSTYLPLATHLKTEGSLASKQSPILMIHGNQDSIIDLTFAKYAERQLRQCGYAPEFRVYPMAHQVCVEEIQAISEFLNKVILSVQSE